MLKEILKSYLFQIEKKNYSKIFLFNNSDGIYRPMWSYLKKPNLKIYFFFFGGNCMPFENDNLSDVKKFKLYFSSNYYGLQFWSWENYLFGMIFKISYQKNLINKKISYEMDRCIEVNYKNFLKIMIKIYYHFLILLLMIKYSLLKDWLRPIIILKMPI